MKPHRSFFKKLLWILVAGVPLALLTPVAVSHAQTQLIASLAASGGTGGAEAVGKVASAVTGFSASAVGFLSFYVVYAVTFVMGAFVALEAWALGVVLYINDTVFQSVFVQSGFSVSLSIANLAFVTGIIVIAIATIIRNESYGIKKLLWKLVVAAVLANFGLVLAAPIFGAANSFTRYFMSCISPTSGGCGTADGTFGNYSTFARTFAGAFQPQTSFVTASGQTTAGANQTITGQSLSGFLSATGSNIGKILVALFGMVMSLMNVLLIVVVLAVLAILFLIRYVYVAILAILMPFAFASWVFPLFGKHWEKWWSNFLRWTFFAPISVFFIYLAMLLMQTSYGTTGSIATQITQSDPNSIYSGLTGLVGNMFTPVLGGIVQEIVFCALILGGLFAANSMGLAGAKGVTNTAKSAGNWTKKQAALASKKSGRWAFQKAGGDRLTHRLQTGNIGAFKYVPGAKRGASALGRSLAEGQTNQALVTAAAKHVPKDREEVKANLQGSMNNQKMFAHLQEAVKGGYIDENFEVNGRKFRDILDDKDLIARYGQGKLVADADKMLMSNTDIRNAQRAMEKADEARRNGKSEAEIQRILQVPVTAKEGLEVNGEMKKQGESVNANDLMKAAMDDLVLNMKKEDFGKINAKAVLGKKDEKKEPVDAMVQNIRMKSIATQNQTGLSTMISKLKAADVRNLEKIYPAAIKEEQVKVNNTINNISIDKTMTEDEQRSEIERLGLERQKTQLSDAQKNFKRILRQNVFSLGHSENSDDKSSGGGSGGGGEGGDH